LQSSLYDIWIRERVLAIFILIRLIKLIVDTIIHDYASFCIRMESAFRSNLGFHHPHFLLHLAGSATRKLQEVKT